MLQNTKVENFSKPVETAESRANSFWWEIEDLREPKDILDTPVELKKVTVFAKGQELTDCSILNPSSWNPDFDDGAISFMVTLLR